MAYTTLDTPTTLTAKLVLILLTVVWTLGWMWAGGGVGLGNRLDCGCVRACTYLIWTSVILIRCPVQFRTCSACHQNLGDLMRFVLECPVTAPSFLSLLYQGGYPPSLSGLWQVWQDQTYQVHNIMIRFLPEFS